MGAIVIPSGTRWKLKCPSKKHVELGDEVLEGDPSKFIVASMLIPCLSTTIPRAFESSDMVSNYGWRGKALSESEVEVFNNFTCGYVDSAEPLVALMREGGRPGLAVFDHWRRSVANLQMDESDLQRMYAYLPYELREHRDMPQGTEALVEALVTMCTANAALLVPTRVP